MFSSILSSYSFFADSHTSNACVRTLHVYLFFSSHPHSSELPMISPTCDFPLVRCSVPSKGACSYLFLIAVFAAILVYFLSLCTYPTHFLPPISHPIPLSSFALRLRCFPLAMDLVCFQFCWALGRWLEGRGRGGGWEWGRGTVIKGE